MQLSEPTIQTLLKTIDICKLFDIEQFIMEPDIIKGITEPYQVAIITPAANDIESAIAFNRLDILAKRLKLTDNPVIECDSNGNYCHKLHIKSKKLKAEYICANPNLIKAPRDLGVNKLCSITIPDDLHANLNKMFAAVKTKNISILADDGQLMFKFVDESNEQMIYADGMIISQERMNFANSYDAKLFLKAIQKCDDAFFTLSEKGVLSFTIEGLNIHLLMAK